MIIDSHSHYFHHRFDSVSPCVFEKNGELGCVLADREELLFTLRDAGIVGCIEPSIGIDTIEKQQRLAESHPTFIRTAVGVHPTRCIHTGWKSRRELLRYALHPSVVAIGELGLDYHIPRKKQRRFWQRAWFLYQIKLAHRSSLPLVLHIREADRDAVRILKRNKRKLCGGVVHCFSGSLENARDYVALGLSLGIGGKLLSDDDYGRELCDIVREIPLEHILVETDAPYVIPDTWELPTSKSERKKLCNSSLILCAVIRKIAELKGVSEKEAEERIYENTVAIFSLK